MVKVDGEWTLMIGGGLTDALNPEAWIQDDGSDEMLGPMSERVQPRQP